VSRKTESPAIPEGGEDAIQAIKEGLEIGLGRRGNQLERFVTFRDLVDGGFSVEGGAGKLRITGIGDGDGDGGGGLFPGDPGGDVEIGDDDLTKPPRPVNVRARGLSLDSIGVSWGPPGYNNHYYAEVFASRHDNWSQIAASFDVTKPVTFRNQCPYLMGKSTGSLFLHTDLNSTVPSISSRTAIHQIELDPALGPLVRFAGEHQFSVDDTVIFSGTDWDNSGYVGKVVQVFVDSIRISIDFNYRKPLVDEEGNYLPNNTLPTDVLVSDSELIREANQDELEAALNPETIFYWVRFVSAANVVGDPQSEEGVPGQVMLNPEAILDILVGRIRMSNLANELIAPITYVQGPLIPRLDLSDERFEILSEDVITQIGRIDALDYEINNEGGRLSAVEGYFISSGFGGGESFAAFIDDLRINVTNEDSTLTQLKTWQIGLDPAGDGLALASKIDRIDIKAEANRIAVDGLESLEIRFDDGLAEGVGEIIARIAGRELVNLDDEGALVHISDKLVLDLGGENVSLNQLAQNVHFANEAIYNSITLKVQQNSSGVITAAGFGIGMQGDPSDPGSLISTFAVSADQFAIMSPGSQGRLVTGIFNKPGYSYQLRLSPGEGDKLQVGKEVTVAFPSDAPTAIVNAFRGRTYKVKERSPSYISINLVDPDSGVDSPARPESLGYTGGLEGYACYPIQNVPFVVDSKTGTVGIRGTLVVDGMISANEAEINDLLRANEIWSRRITNHGLAYSTSILGEAIATPRRSGWAVRMNTPGFDRNYPQTVFQFSRWGIRTDDVGENADPEDYFHLASEGNSPSLNDALKLDTVFSLGTMMTSQGRKGFGYLRGSLLVDGNARIVNLTEDRGHFTQMDNQFPMMIMPLTDALDQSWTDVSPWDNWDYGTGATLSSRMEWVRRNAFFWVDKFGDAGFNTRSGAIYLNDNPLELPASGGNIKVIRRLGRGEGRVFVSATVEVDSNRTSAADRMGVWYLLMLVPSSQSLTIAGSGYRAYSPSSLVLNHRPRETGLGSNFVVLRATGQPSGDVKNIINRYTANVGGINITGYFCNASTPSGRSLSGSVRVAPGSYKAAVVVANLYAQRGGPLYGTPGGGGNDDSGPGGCVTILNGKVHSQQTSDRDGF